MNKTLFNDDNSNRGVEGYYYLEGTTLIVYLKATNDKADWRSNFLCIPWWDKKAHCFVHLGYRNYSKWTKDFIERLIKQTKATRIIAFGYSFGGGVLQEVGEHNLSIPIIIISIDGPRTTSKITSNCTLYYNRGSLVNRVPFWFKRIKNAICLNDKWQPFWKSHGNYDIDKIIRETIG